MANQQGHATEAGSAEPRSAGSHDHRYVVAIDGPAAAGKTAVARRLADRLNAMLFDTGALYRAITLAALRDGVSPDDGEALAKLAASHTINVTLPTTGDGRLYDVYLDGEDVTWKIRTPEVDALVSAVSAHPGVRAALLPVQRRIAGTGKLIMVGRDIGTTVVPDAGTKLFLSASVAERARRRYRELQQRGLDVTLSEIEADLRRRDEMDSHRAASPLRVAPDAIVIDTDARTIDDVVSLAERIIRQRWAAFEAEDERRLVKSAPGERQG